MFPPFAFQFSSLSNDLVSDESSALDDDDDYEDIDEEMFEDEDEDEREIDDESSDEEIILSMNAEARKKIGREIEREIREQKDKNKMNNQMQCPGQRERERGIRYADMIIGGFTTSPSPGTRAHLHWRQPGPG